MASRLPPSPSLSPSRGFYRSVQESPALGFRGTAATQATVAVGSVFSASTLAHAPSASASCPAARHTKSASDLGIRPCLGRYDPTRIVGGTVRNVSPPPSGGHRELLTAPQRTYTPFAPSQALRSTSPSNGKAPPPFNSQAYSPRASPVLRSCSVERRAPQWSAVAFPSDSAPRSPLSHSVAASTTQLSRPGVSQPLHTGSLVCSPGPASWTSARGATRMQTPGSKRRSVSQNSEGHGACGLDLLSARVSTTTDKHYEARSSGTQSSRRAPSHPYLQVVPNSSVPADSAYEAQVSNARNSLLQHIHNVQKEIMRLQEEQRAKQAGLASQTATGMSASVPQSASAQPTSVHTTVTARSVAGATMTSSTIKAEASKPVAAGENETTLYEPDVLTQSFPASKVQPQLQARSQVPPSPVAVAHSDARAKRRSDSGLADQLDPQGSLSRDVPQQRPRAPVHHCAARIQRAWRISRWRRKFVSFSERKMGWVGTLDWLQQHNLLYGTELADPEDVRWWMQHRADAPLDSEVDPWGSTKLRDHLNKMWYGRTTEELEAERWLQAQQEQQRLTEDVYIHHGVVHQEPCILQDTSSRSARQWQLEPTLAHGSTSLLPDGSARGVAPVVAGANGTHVWTTASASAAGAASAREGASWSASGEPLRSPTTTERAIGATTRQQQQQRGSTPLLSKSTSLSPRREAVFPRASQPSPTVSSGRPTRSLLASGAPPPSAKHSAQSPLQSQRSARTTTATLQSARQSTLQAPTQASAAAARPRSPMQSHRAGAGGQSARLSLHGQQQSQPLRPVPAAAPTSAGQPATARAAGVRR
eukprot:TRINITY_DN21551_c0_g1_i1.p1 TRINITY_DN21551_c0_g1~~TRINITY_DN21551_c0_g1_i1.p1  ORF type:complete len:819 (-),score=121.50 TRINITY_DN21551_c0_g1_i1:20-2476(-)